jgi:hypothetical protein
MMQDEDVEDDDEDVETLQGVLQYLSSLQWYSDSSQCLE